MGSHAYGLAGPGSDADWRGVFAVGTDEVLGLRDPAATVELPPDQVYWEARHFCRLPLKGNPNLIELLWLEPRFVVVTSPFMDELRDLRDGLLGRAMAAAYLGWVRRERLAFAPRSEEAGWDARADREWRASERALRLAGKPGSHLVRLLLSLRGAFHDRILRVTFTGTDRELLLGIKRGEVEALAAATRVRPPVRPTRKALFHVVTSRVDDPRCSAPVAEGGAADP